jgi:hypothetical protein
VTGEGEDASPEAEALRDEQAAKDAEQALRVASDNFLTRVERLHALEEQKRELDPARIEGIAQEVESLTREILDWAERQSSLAEAVAQTEPGGGTPIAVIPPRPLNVVLAEWRAAERALAEAEPATAAWESANADVERLRDEYARAYNAQATT